MTEMLLLKCNVRSSLSKLSNLSLWLLPSRDTLSLDECHLSWGSPPPFPFHFPPDVSDSAKEPSYGSCDGQDPPSAPAVFMENSPMVCACFVVSFSSGETYEINKAVTKICWWLFVIKTHVCTRKSVICLCPEMNSWAQWVKMMKGHINRSHQQRKSTWDEREEKTTSTWSLSLWQIRWKRKKRTHHAKRQMQGNQVISHCV